MNILKKCFKTFKMYFDWVVLYSGIWYLFTDLFVLWVVYNHSPAKTTFDVYMSIILSTICWVYLFLEIFTFDFKYRGIFERDFKKHMRMVYKNDQ